jgi:hypothetical protein
MPVALVGQALAGVPAAFGHVTGDGRGEADADRHVAIGMEHAEAAAEVPLQIEVGRRLKWKLADFDLLDAVELERPRLAVVVRERYQVDRSAMLGQAQRIDLVLDGFGRTGRLIRWSRRAA